MSICKPKILKDIFLRFEHAKSCKYKMAIRNLTPSERLKPAQVYGLLSKISVLITLVKKEIGYKL
jgi:hypothetical protein